MREEKRREKKKHTSGECLPQTVNGLGIFDTEGVQVFAAANFELGVVRVLFDGDEPGVLSASCQ